MIGFVSFSFEGNNKNCKSYSTLMLGLLLVQRYGTLNILTKCIGLLVHRKFNVWYFQLCMSIINFFWKYVTTRIIFLNQVSLNKMDPGSINEFSNTLNFYITLLIMPGLAATISLLMFYIRNKNMRRFLALEIQDWFGKIMEKFDHNYKKRQTKSIN